jgi:hypothetical protein
MVYVPFKRIQTFRGFLLQRLDPCRDFLREYFDLLYKRLLSIRLMFQFT